MGPKTAFFPHGLDGGRQYALARCIIRGVCEPAISAPQAWARAPLGTQQHARATLKH
jgi:hypothetical protein